MNMMITTSRQLGFTLMELLVVIAIIGIMSSVVLASLNAARVKARDTKRIADLQQIRTALELHYHDHGYYPSSPCGWDCNGYRRSYNPTEWSALAADLAPYMPTLPVDPINVSNYPWYTGGYSYAYGNVGRTAYPDQYDLTAQLEGESHPQSCGVRGWTFYFDDRGWCSTSGGGYSNQLYEASPK